ncbi:hypothetical protein [Sphingomonas sp. 3-13AW]|uniref:hypothetical protein n=1 Tax=Sphingomonas sp. 3-13AW TaxID=3050450 RepID=UPI003BB54F91
MKEIEWCKAPTVYRVIVDGAAIPFTETRQPSLRAILRRRVAMKQASRLLHATYEVDRFNRLTDPSVTFVVAEDLGEAVDLHLRLWNGIRIRCSEDVGFLLYDVCTFSPENGWCRSGWLTAFMARDHLARHPHVCPAGRSRLDPA